MRDLTTTTAPRGAAGVGDLLAATGAGSTRRVDTAAFDRVLRDVRAADRSEDRRPDRPADRTTERAADRTAERAADRAAERAADRAEARRAVVRDRGRAEDPYEATGTQGDRVAAPGHVAEQRTRPVQGPAAADRPGGPADRAKGTTGTTGTQVGPTDGSDATTDATAAAAGPQGLGAAGSTASTATAAASTATAAGSVEGTATTGATGPGADAGTRPAGPMGSPGGHAPTTTPAAGSVAAVTTGAGTPGGTTATTPAAAPSATTTGATGLPGDGAGEPHPTVPPTLAGRVGATATATATATAAATATATATAAAATGAGRAGLQQPGALGAAPAGPRAVGEAGLPSQAGSAQPTTGQATTVAPTATGPAPVGVQAGPSPTTPAAAPGGASIGPFTLQQLEAVAAATRTRLAGAALGDVTRLVLHLNPAELGPVRITAEHTAAGIDIGLAGGDEATREVLRGALTDLRQQLGDGQPRDATGWGGSSGDGGRQADRRASGGPAALPYGPPVADVAGRRAPQEVAGVTREPLTGRRSVDVRA